MNNPQLQRGNDYLIKCPYNILNPDGGVSPVDVATMTDIEVSLFRGDVKTKEQVEYTRALNYFIVSAPATLTAGQYSIVISGKLAGRNVRDARRFAFTLVEWAEGADAGAYVQGNKITLAEGTFVLSADTTAINEVIEQLQQATAEAEAAKEEWQRKAEEFDGGDAAKSAYESMKRLQEYLYTIEYSKLDYEAARAFFKTHFAPINGACTALRKGDIIGRNYDWTYSKEVSFLVRTKSHNGRYASIGMAGSIAALTTDTIGEYSEEFKYMPFRLLDGLNEKGVYANVNMLNNADGRTLPTTGTVPLIEERERICSAMLVRYILDNFATPQEACEYIRNYVSVYPPYHDGATTDLHFAVSSKEQLYYLCFEQENGVWRTMYVDVKDQPLPFVMTNFRMWWAQYIFDQQTGHYDRFRDPDYDYVEKYGMGIERANLCLDFVRDTSGSQSMMNFLTYDIKYTNAYDTYTNPQWLTEFVGQYSQEDLARNSAAEDFDRILGIVRQRYAERSRETALTWQTVHSVVYNLDNLTMQLVVQEGNADDALTIDCFKSLPATKEDVDNIDLSSVAQQGDNPNATNTAIYAKVQGIQPVIDAATAYNEGKTALAAAISAKGVQTEPSESLAQMADNVQLIQQETYELQGDELYEKQMYGAATDTDNPYVQEGSLLWNLYAVMAALKSDGRFINYGGILLAEYFKGYDSIELMNAGAGGAYYTCDGDFYTTDRAGANAHIWHDGDNGKMNRWVAYLFASAGTNYTIPSTNLCPRSIHIGRNVGTINMQQEGRIREIVVTDGNELGGTNFGNYANVWSQEVVLNNLGTINGVLFYNNSILSSAIVDCKSIAPNSTIMQVNSSTGTIPSCLIVKGLQSVDLSGQTNSRGVRQQNVAYEVKLAEIIFQDLEYCKNFIFVNEGGSTSSIPTCNLHLPKLKYWYGGVVESVYSARFIKNIYLDSLEEANRGGQDYGHFVSCENLKYIYIGYSDNDRTKSVELIYRATKPSGLTDIELKQGYCKNLNISSLTDVLTEENIINHILNRLGGDGTGLTITIGATNLARVTSAEGLAALERATNLGFTIA